MKILLLQPAWNILKNRRESKQGALEPIGLAYIAAVLEQADHEVKIIDVAAEGYWNETIVRTDFIRYGLSVEELKKQVGSYSPDVVGVSCIQSARMYEAHEIIDLTKEVSRDIVTVMGGVHPTCFPEQTLENANLDYVIMGEGEYSFLYLVENLGNTNLDTMDGIAYRKDGEVVVRPQTRFVMDLDELPFPAHHLTPLDLYVEIWKREGYLFYEAEKFIMTVTSRGCPLGCDHCPNHVIFGRKTRVRSPKNIVDEIEHAQKTLGVKEVQFHEYNGFMSKQRIRDFCNELINRGINVKWDFPIGNWLKALDREMLELMWDAGCEHLNLPLETQNEDILRNTMGAKGVYLKHVSDVIKWGREIGYYMHCFFMIGFLGQTKADIEETLAFSRTLDIDSLSFFIAQPLPETVFWEKCEKKGLFIDNFDPSFLRYGKGNLNTNEWTGKELEEFRYRGRKEFTDFWLKKGRKPYLGLRGGNYLMKRT